MRIVIDMQAFQWISRRRGIGRYTSSLVSSLSKLKNNKDEIILILNGAKKDSIKELNEIIDKSKCTIKVWYPVEPCFYFNNSNNGNRQASEILFSQYIESLNPDFFLVTSMFEGLGENAVTIIPKNRRYYAGVILYDLIPLIYPDTYLNIPINHKWYQEKISFLKEADMLFSISASAAKEAIDYLSWDESKVTNISSATDVKFHTKELSTNTIENLFQRFSLKKDFILYTGGFDHRKNMDKLIEAYALLSEELRKKHQLVIVCSIPENEKNKLIQLALSNHIKKDQIVLTGYIEDEDLINLYNLCYLFVFPSLHEGFGLPVLEAMLCGRPVITSNVSSLPEVINYEDALFDPKDIQSIAKKMEQALTDNALRERLINQAKEQVKNFSWDLTAEKFYQTISKMCEEKKADAPSQRSYMIEDKIDKNSQKKKMAYFSPILPEKSGISAYSSELLPYLTHYYDIDIISNAEEPITDEWVKNNLNIKSINWFEEHFKDYERILYHLGNSHFHAHMFNLLKSYPGVVVHHDFYLTNVMAWMQQAPQFKVNLRETLYRAHGLKPLLNNSLTDVDIMKIYPANLEVIENSKAVIFHSTNSIKLAEKWYGDHFNKKYTVIPHLRIFIDNIDKKSAREQLNIGADELVIINLGFIAETKLNHKIIDAFNDLNCDVTNIRLVFVGHVDLTDYGKEIIEQISRSPYKNKITITGWVDEEQYKLWLAAADMAIQLRTQSRGETSGTVLDCLNYGLATIINKNGSMNDIAENCALKLEDEFQHKELVNAMQQLITDQALRKKLGREARTLIKEKHDPRECARLYYNYIEKSYANKNYLDDCIEQIKDVSQYDPIKLCKSLNYTFPLDALPKIFVDISYLIYHKNQETLAMKLELKQIIHSSPDNVRIIPVYYKQQTDEYYYAHTYLKTAWQLTQFPLIDEPIDYSGKDNFVIYNLEISGTTNKYEHLFNLTTKITSLVFTLSNTNINSLIKVITQDSDDNRKALINCLSLGTIYCESNDLAQKLLNTFKANSKLGTKLDIKVITNEPYIKTVFHTDFT